MLRLKLAFSVYAPIDDSSGILVPFSVASKPMDRSAALHWLPRLGREVAGQPRAPDNREPLIEERCYGCERNAD